MAYTGVEIYRTFLLADELDSLSIGESKLALFSQLFSFKQEGKTLVISAVNTINSRQLDILMELTHTGESDNPCWSEKLMKQAFLECS